MLDLIGAARPSIADPFLPKKIEEGRLEDIRECIGCNVCIASYAEGRTDPLHPEPGHGRGVAPRLAPGAGAAQGLRRPRCWSSAAGPAGLECARVLGRRGYEVTLAEAGHDLGGRVLKEATLPGLASWRRVVDYRLGQISQLANVSVYLESALTAADVREVGADRVVLACGARWTKESYDPVTGLPCPAPEAPRILTPDDLLEGAEPESPVLIFDFDNYFMGGCLAELLRGRGLEVGLATPHDQVSPWTAFTGEQGLIRTKLLSLGAALFTGHTLSAYDGERAQLTCLHSQAARELRARSLVLVGLRAPQDGLYHELEGAALRIGDCLAPGALVHAVTAGYRAGYELDQNEALWRPESPRRETALV